LPAGAYAPAGLSPRHASSRVSSSGPFLSSRAPCSLPVIPSAARDLPYASNRGIRSGRSSEERAREVGQLRSTREARPPPGPLEHLAIRLPDAEDQLTRRELQIADGVSGGAFRNKEIARQLRISQETVKRPEQHLPRVEARRPRCGRPGGSGTRRPTKGLAIAKLEFRHLFRGQAKTRVRAS
jgi:hypothetical protein